MPDWILFVSERMACRLPNRMEIAFELNETTTWRPRLSLSRSHFYQFIFRFLQSGCRCSRHLYCCEIKSHRHLSRALVILRAFLFFGCSLKYFCTNCMPSLACELRRRSEKFIMQSSKFTNWIINEWRRRPLSLSQRSTITSHLLQFYFNPTNVANGNDNKKQEKVQMKKQERS